MLYYQFAVAPARTHEDYHRLGYGIASIMVKLEDNISACTTRAASYLAREHWDIAEIRKARLIETEEELVGDERLLALYREAEQSGIAGALAVPGVGFSRSVLAEEPVVAA
jgi:hypothetical protein